jgi:hypothetical protein
METSHLGKWLIFVGLGILALGILLFFGGKLGMPMGKLPGDISMHKEKFSLHFPIATSIILSILLTLILNLIFWFMRK